MRLEDRGDQLFALVNVTNRPDSRLLQLLADRRPAQETAASTASANPPWGDMSPLRRRREGNIMSRRLSRLLIGDRGSVIAIRGPAP